jgi:hypothetical protein
MQTLVKCREKLAKVLVLLGRFARCFRRLSTKVFGDFATLTFHLYSLVFGARQWSALPFAETAVQVG